VGGEAKHFLTSGLNGGSVIIEGTLEHPTVYHINAGSFRTTTGNIDDNKLHDDRIGRTLEIERQWRHMKESSNQSDPFKSAGQTPAPAAALHGHHYLPNYFRNNPQEENDIDQVYRDEATNSGIGALTRIDHTAAVIGIRSKQTGHWAFWCQVRARVRNNGGQFHYIVGLCAPIWPNVANYQIQRGVHTLSNVLIQPVFR